MESLADRVAECFLTVFPGLNANDIARANVTSVAEWDSLATMTLIAVLEEEFHIRLPLEVYPELISFDIIVDEVTQLANA
jgi:acyl carrier protein